MVVPNKAVVVPSPSMACGRITGCKVPVLASYSRTNSPFGRNLLRRLEVRMLKSCISLESGHETGG